jgi:hypothetical protein
MNSTTVKNLSIACEAPSRISGLEAKDLRRRIMNQIDTILTEEEKPKPKPQDPNADRIPF